MTDSQRLQNVVDRAREELRPAPGTTKRYALVHDGPDAKVSLRALGVLLVPGIGRWTEIPGGLAFTMKPSPQSGAIPPMTYSYERNGLRHRGSLTLIEASADAAIEG